MADERDPIESVREELDEHEETDAEREAREASEREAERSREHEREGEELRALDSKVTKLCEDVESWKNQTLSAVEAATEQLRQSTREALEAAASRPEPVLPQNPPAPVEPPSDQEQPPNPESGAGVPPAPKTDKPAKQGKKLRFL